MLCFQLLSDEGKRKYIFPDERDISKAFEAVYTKKESSVIHEGEDRIRIYGNALILDRLSNSCGVYDDLISVFGKETADKVISIAYYLILPDKILSYFENVSRVRCFYARME